MTACVQPPVTLTNKSHTNGPSESFKYIHDSTLLSSASDSDSLKKGCVPHATTCGNTSFGPSRNIVAPLAFTSTCVVTMSEIVHLQNILTPDHAPARVFLTNTGSTAVWDAVGLFCAAVQVWLSWWQSISPLFFCKSIWCRWLYNVETLKFHSRKEVPSSKHKKQK